MAWAGNPRSGPNHSAFCRRKTNCKTIGCSHRQRQLMMFQESIGWMFRILMILKTWKIKTRNQRRPKLTGRESSDDKVSFSLLRYKIPKFWELCKEKTCPYFVGDGCIYSVVEAVTCLVTSPTFVEIRG